MFILIHGRNRAELTIWQLHFIWLLTWMATVSGVRHGLYSNFRWQKLYEDYIELLR